MKYNMFDDFPVGAKIVKTTMYLVFVGISKGFECNVLLTSLKPVDRTLITKHLYISNY